jgi:hypothetical protein
VADLKRSAKMSWYLESQNPEALRSLFPSTPPLKRLHVLRLALSENGPALSIAADLDIFAERVPSKWHPSYSVAQVKISFWGIRNLSIVGWTTINSYSIDVTKKESVVMLHLKSESSEISAQCEFFRIDGIVGYAKEPDQSNHGAEPAATDNAV